MSRIIYIAGPMSGLPEFNFPAFFDAEEKLREQGLLVENPARNEKYPSELPNRESLVWQWYMRAGITQLMSCGEIALLPGWQDSRGAKLEALIAQHLGMPTWDYRDGQLHEPGTVPPLDASGAVPARSTAGGV